MNKLQANLCLLSVTLLWSTEVVIFACIPDGVEPLAVTCVTYLIGAGLLGLCFAGRVVRALRTGGAGFAVRCVLLGVLNGVYSVLFLYGLSYFDVSGGAFAFALTAVFMPVALAAFRRAVGGRAWISAGVVAMGVAVAFAGQIGVAELPGLGLMAAGCFVRCCFIVKLNDFARRYDPVSVSALLCATVGIASFVPWAVVQPETFAALDLSATTLAALFVYAYFVVAFATSVNVFAQAHASAMDAALIYALEIVFSVVWAVVLPASLVEPSQLTLQVGAGCLLVVAGNVVGQVGPSRRSALSVRADAGPCLGDEDPVVGKGLP